MRFRSKLVMASAVSCVQWASQQAAVDLIQGVPIERELSGGESHVYQVTLAAGQFLRAVTEQRGIDLRVAVLSPDGKDLVSIDYLSSLTGYEPVLVLAETSGTYSLAISPVHKDSPRGRYGVRIAELRRAAPEDSTRFRAQEAFAQGRKLQDRGTADSYAKCLAKYEEALILWKAAGDQWEEAITLNQIGEVSFATGKSELAAGRLYAALALWQSPVEGADRGGKAQTLSLLGDVKVGMGEPRQAVDFYSESLQLWRDAGDAEGEADALNHLGVVFRQLGELQMALQHYTQSLDARRALADRQGQSQTLYNIGLLHFSLGENQRALERLNDALQISHAVPDPYGSAIILDLIGFIHTSLGDYERAAQFYASALRLSKETGNKVTETLILQDIGTNCRMMGDPRKALEYLNPALSSSRSLNHQQLQATVLGSIAAVYADLGNETGALHFYDEALVLHREADRVEGEVTTLLEMGWLDANLGDTSKASEAFGGALTLSRSIGFRRGEARAMLGSARVAADSGHLMDARADLEEALPIVESTRTALDSQDLRASYFASIRNYYEMYIDVLMRLGQTQAAFAASERARARSLLETLTEAHADVRRGADPELLDREHTLEQQLNATERRRMQLLSQKDRAEQAQNLEKELNGLLSDYQDVEARIRTTSPHYAALAQPQPLALKEIRQQVLDKDSMLLEYALGEDRSYLWAVTPADIKGFELPKRAEIETAAKRAYELLKASNKREFQRQTELVLGGLSRMLLGPVAGRIGQKRLLIVSDGALEYIPFEGLPEPGATASQPLIVQHEIVSLPSASVLAVLRQEVALRKPAPKAVAILSDPVFEMADPRVRGSKTVLQIASNAAAKNDDFGGRELTRSATDSGLVRFERLPFSRKEADSVEALTEPRQMMKALDFSASKATATSAEIGQFRIVHFATHALINSQHPELSGIVLSLVDEQGQTQDGFLRMHEIYNLNLGADLVVLSACQTALGKEIKGEGLMGLTRGFMYAGSPRVVASLWDVRDEATAELMKRFYQGMLKENLRPAAALRAAQVSMLKEKRWEAPYYWAPFVIHGEWR